MQAVHKRVTVDQVHIILAAEEAEELKKALEAAIPAMTFSKRRTGMSAHRAQLDGLVMALNSALNAVDDEEEEENPT